MTSAHSLFYFLLFPSYSSLSYRSSHCLLHPLLSPTLPLSLPSPKFIPNFFLLFLNYQLFTVFPCLSFLALCPSFFFPNSFYFSHFCLAALLLVPLLIPFLLSAALLLSSLSTTSSLMFPSFPILSSPSPSLPLSFIFHFPFLSPSLSALPPRQVMLLHLAYHMG